MLNSSSHKLLIFLLHISNMLLKLAISCVKLFIEIIVKRQIEFLFTHQISDQTGNFQRMLYLRVFLLPCLLILLLERLVSVEPTVYL